jgi:threonine/homoserine/homoserine lactone efflux protein
VALNLDLYLAFVVATAVLILIPGPLVSLVVAHSLAHGSRRALVTVAGSSTVISLQLIALGLGMTSILLVLSEWFEVLRWAGVTYLIFLGIQYWRARPPNLDPTIAQPAVSTGRLFWQGFLVNGTNPKTLLFYAAFFPQFIDPALPAMSQMIFLGLTFVTIATILDGGYALLGGRLRGLLHDQRRQRLRNRLTGSLLISAGLGLALARRS